MSLINDALKDLDERASTQIESRTSASAEPAKTKVLEKTFLSRRNIFLSFGLATSFCFIVGFHFSTLIEGTDQGEHEADVKPRTELPVAASDTNATTTLSTVVEASEKAELAEPVAETPSAAPINPVTVSANEVNADAFNRLLILAQNALENDRLSSPAKNNAVYYFRKILELDKSNKLAVSGLESVNKRYLTLIDAAYEQADYKRVSVLSERALSLVDGDIKEELQSKLLAYLEPSQPTTSRGATAASRTNLSNTQAATEIKIAPSAEQLERARLEEYSLQMSKGLHAKALAYLQLGLQKPSASSATVETVLKHHIQFKQYDELAKFLSEREALSEQWPYAKAKLILHTQGEEEAHSYLSHTYEQKPLDEDARALFAGMLNQRQEYQLSSKLYKELVALNPRESVYWLGLALAEENLGRDSQAYKAYSESLNLGAQNAQVVDFIQSRMKALRSSAGQNLELSQW